MRAFVTGARGFIGGRLTQALPERGHLLELVRREPQAREPLDELVPRGAQVYAERQQRLRRDHRLGGFGLGLQVGAAERAAVRRHLVFEQPAGAVVDDWELTRLGRGSVHQVHPHESAGRGESGRRCGLERGGRDGVEVVSAAATATAGTGSDRYWEC